MASDGEDRLGAGAGLVSILIVGVSVLATGTAVGDTPLTTAVWWLAYGIYLVAFLLAADVLGRTPSWGVRATLGVLVVSGPVVWFLAPGVGWSALLFVVTAATAAYELRPPALGALVVGQSAAIAAGAAMAAVDTADVVFSTVAYLSFQVFAAIVVTSARRESEARAELASAHADLRAATELLAASSANTERLRIARDLHDVIGHQLTALALELEVATHRATGGEAEHVARARDIAKGLLGDVRAAVGELRDAPVGLEPTLRTLVERVPGLDVGLDVRESVPLSDASTIAIVRCAQEVVTNAMRHGHASSLQLTVVSDEVGLRLHAQDDGIGARRIEPGNGLTGMAERVEQLGGALTLGSAQGKGFSVRIEVPAS